MSPLDESKWLGLSDFYTIRMQLRNNLLRELIQKMLRELHVSVRYTDHPAQHKSPLQCPIYKTVTQSLSTCSHAHTFQAHVILFSSFGTWSKIDNAILYAAIAVLSSRLLFSTALSSTSKSV